VIRRDRGVVITRTAQQKAQSKSAFGGSKAHLAGIALAERRVRRRRSTPMLSHHDRTELEKIERHLELSDPGLAAALRDGRRRKPRAVKTALLVALDVAAVVLLVVGLVLPDPGLMLCGILALTGTVWTHVARHRN
jgi:hypothetical protein